MLMEMSVTFYSCPWLVLYLPFMVDLMLACQTGWVEKCLYIISWKRGEKMLGRVDEARLNLLLMTDNLFFMVSIICETAHLFPSYCHWCFISTSQPEQAEQLSPLQTCRGVSACVRENLSAAGWQLTFSKRGRQEAFGSTEREKNYQAQSMKDDRA